MGRLKMNYEVRIKNNNIGLKYHADNKKSLNIPKG